MGEQPRYDEPDWDGMHQHLLEDLARSGSDDPAEDRSRVGIGEDLGPAMPATGTKLTEREIWFAYRGRITVGQYWGRGVLMGVATIPAAFIIGGLASTRDAYVVGVLVLLGFTSWPATALAWKRLQDQNKPGALYLLILVPLVGGLIWFVLSLSPGTPGPNRYGPDSRYRYHTNPLSDQHGDPP